MKSKFTTVFILVVTIVSCRKSNTTNPVTPAPEALMNWTMVDSLPSQNPNDIWFTSASNGFLIGAYLYQTTDGGLTWKNPGLGFGSYFNLFFTDAQHGFVETLTQLLITNDGGNSWKAVTLPTSGAQTIFFVNQAEGFYGDYHGGGLMKTVDSGKTWVNIFNDPGTAQGFYPFFVNADTGFVAMASGNFASTTDGGINWKSGIGVLPADSKTTAYSQLFFISQNIGFYGYRGGISRTMDGGQSWQNVLSVTENPKVQVSVIHFVDGNTGYYMTGSAIYKSSDGGQTWTINCQLGNDVFAAMNFSDNHTGWAATDGGRLLKTQQ
jgi:photosystem II stability/assembly factor-like uncharacterized protein